nr:helix-turn-helix domain-containing protein [Rhodococcus sp. 06-621-2]
MSGDIGRLGDAVRARRAELGLSQLELWKSGGPSNSTLTNIESGRPTPIHPKTLRKLDYSLGWTPGSAYHILHRVGTDERYRPSPGGDFDAMSRTEAVPEQCAAALLYDAEQARRALERFASRQIDLDVLAARVYRLIDTAEQTVRTIRPH